MKICKMVVCNREARAQGYCNGHYWRWKGGHPLDGEIKDYPHAKKDCKKIDCNRSHYAKGLCRNHYARSMYTLKTSSCKIKSCKRKSQNEYCAKHKARIDAGLSTDLRRRFAYRGEKHWSWRGGVAEYPNHSELKRTRKLKLKSVNYECEEKCGKKATVTHHLDKSKDNHSFNNLKALCHKCHLSIYHKGEMGRKTLVPGYSLMELAKKIGCSLPTIRNYLKFGRKSMHFQIKINQVLKEIGYEKEEVCKKN